MNRAAMFFGGIVCCWSLATSGWGQTRSTVSTAGTTPTTVGATPTAVGTTPTTLGTPAINSRQISPSSLVNPTTPNGAVVISGTNNTTLLPGSLNQTNVFGEIVGPVTVTNPAITKVTPAMLVSNQFGGLSAIQNTNASSATISATTIGGQTIQTVTPGFTVVTITLTGNVQNEADRQAILQRFNGLPGFVVNDQIQVNNATGTAVNEAAGASTAGTTTATIGTTTTGTGTTTTGTGTTTTGTGTTSTSTGSGTTGFSTTNSP